MSGAWFRAGAGEARFDLELSEVEGGRADWESYGGACTVQHAQKLQMKKADRIIRSAF